MPELTLEALAKRVESLEKKVAELSQPAIRPGTGNWDAAEMAISKLEDYDFNAQSDQDKYDQKHARDHLP
jgi:hypothetical protein